MIQAQHDPLDFGSQLEFKPNSKWDINRNTYIGNERSTINPGYKARYFGNIYAAFTPSDKWSFTALSSASLGYNLGITGDVLFRLEARYFGSPGQLYPLRDGTTTNKDLWLTAGITARFR